MVEDNSNPVETVAREKGTFITVPVKGRTTVQAEGLK